MCDEGIRRTRVVEKDTSIPYSSLRFYLLRCFGLQPSRASALQHVSFSSVPFGSPGLRLRVEASS